MKVQATFAGQTRRHQITEEGRKLYQLIHHFELAIEAPYECIYALNIHDFDKEPLKDMFPSVASVFVKLGAELSVQLIWQSYDAGKALWQLTPSNERAEMHVASMVATALETSRERYQKLREHRKTKRLKKRLVNRAVNQAHEEQEYRRRLAELQEAFRNAAKEHAEQEAENLREKGEATLAIGYEQFTPEDVDNALQATIKHIDEMDI